MKIRRKPLDESVASTGQPQTRSPFDPAPIVLVSSLALLLGSGWLASGGLKLAISGLSAVLLIGALVKVFRTLDFSSPRLVNGTARQLAWIRIVVCLTALIYTVMEDLPAVSSYPLGMRFPKQFFLLLHSLPGYSAFLSSAHLLAVLQWTTAALLLFGLIGFQARTTLFLGGLGFFSMQAILRDYTYQYHSGLVLLYLVLILPWTPCAARWSIDRLLHRENPQPARQAVGLAVYACFVVMAAVYLISGLSKLRDSGLDWFRGDNIEHKLIEDALSPIFFDYKWKATIWLVQHQAPEYVFAIIGAVGLMVELGYVTVLFSRTAQIIMPMAALGIHLGILVFQNILFLDLLILQLIFLDIDRVADFCRTRFQTSEQPANAQVSNDRSRLPLSYFGAATVSVIVATFLLAWTWVLEYYPLSAWRMYANPERKEPAIYYKIVATLEDGRSITVPTRNFSPAVLPNARHLFRRAFRTVRRSEIFDQFIAVYVQRCNRNLTFGSPISSIEVQRWRWNYALEPNNARFGWITNIYPFDAIAKP